jgi:hypothetical protein
VAQGGERLFDCGDGILTCGIHVCNLTFIVI